MKKKLIYYFILVVLAAGSDGRAHARPSTAALTDQNDLLVKFESTEAKAEFFSQAKSVGAEVVKFQTIPWVRVKMPSQKMAGLVWNMLNGNPEVVKIQPNYRVHLLEDYRIKSDPWRKLLSSFKALAPADETKATGDNPEIPGPRRDGKGPDPQLSQQWGMQKIGVQKAWQKTTGRPEIIVAVIDTGVDYTHEDLTNSLWRNPGETGLDANGRDKATNGIDDDGDGHIDDVVGWDFFSKDNRPFDLSMGLMDIITKGGNPGHGTHCAGNVAAQLNNQKGIAGVAPNVKVMALRFLSEKGEGNTADAVEAIEYAVKHGARVLSNSWGSEGEEDNLTGNEVLKDVIRMAQEKGVLFIAAAGNGHQGVGYDNDTDAKPGYPASYDMENIVSVAAIDVNDNLGAFSNWGKTTVDLGAPGVKIFSTVPGNKYQDTILDFLGMKVTWDGTSMATPHVAGAAALYWSLYPEKSWREVKQALLSSVTRISSLEGKTVSGGKLDVGKLVK